SSSKALKGFQRQNKFRQIMSDLVNAQIDLEQAYIRVARDLPPSNSQYRNDNQVFCRNWNKRLVNTYLNRRYCQIILEKLISDKVDLCHVPKARANPSDSISCDKCAQI